MENDQLRPFSLFKRQRKGKKPVYYVRFRLPDGTRTPGRSTGCTSKAKAENWAWAQLNKGKAVRSVTTTLGQYAGGDFFSWENRWAVNRRSTGKRLTQRTCNDKNRLLREHVLEHIGSMKLADISKGTVDMLRNTLFEKVSERTGTTLSGDTINKALEALAAVLRQAEEDGLISAVPTIDKAARHHKARGILTPEEVRTLFSMTWPDYRAYVANLTAAATGLRMGELLALQEQSLSDDGIIYIKRSWAQADRVLRLTTKTGRARYVPIPMKVETELRWLIDTTPWRRHAESFIFYSTSSSAYPMDGKRAAATLETMLDRMGIDHGPEGRNILFHSWRHFANSMMINAQIGRASCRERV